MNVLSTFSGYDAGGWAFKLLGIPITTVGFCEIEKNPIKCLQTNFPDVPQLGSIVGLKDRLPKGVKINLITGGFPCQDVSIAGNRDLNKGRTELFNDLCEVIEHTQPEFLWLENVEGILSAKKKGCESYHTYVLSELRRLGYGVAWMKLNLKDYNNPQNRDRIWYICKKGGWDFMEFTFPEKEELKITLSDLLQPDDEVDKKYYLKPERIRRLLMPESKKTRTDKGRLQTKEFSDCLLTKDYKDPKCIIVGDYRMDEGFRPRLDGNSPCLTRKTGGGDTGQPLIIHNLQKRSIERPSMQKDVPSDLLKCPYPPGNGLPSANAFCIDRGCNQGIEIVSDSELPIIRRITPIEAMRLMGFHNDEINLDGLSDTAIYSLAGNGWDVTVTKKILQQLMKVDDFKRLI